MDKDVSLISYNQAQLKVQFYLSIFGWLGQYFGVGSEI